MKRLILPILFLSILAGTASAQSAHPLFEVSVGKFLMGTKVETTARYPDIIACKESLYLAYREMERVENLLSSHRPESEISQINRAAGSHPVSVCPETFAIIRRAKSYAQRYEALFDISIGPLSELWGFNADREITVPDSNAIAARLKLVDFRNIRLDSLNTTVFLPAHGMAIDLGGIAKGYAIDRGAFILTQRGIRNFMLNAGGDIYVSGRKDAQTDWRVGVKHPRDTDRLVARFDLRDFAVATSGDYERYRIIDGHRYHHIIDPRNGYPGAQSQSATVLASTAEEADATATFLFLLGGENALKDRRLNAPFLIVTATGALCYNDAFARIADIEQSPP